MPKEKSLVLYLLVLIFCFFLGLSLFINLPVLQKEFLFADEATYFAITQSLAYDGDLEYSMQGQDLNRYYRTFGSGPQGIFMKKGKDGKIFFAKSFVYPLFAAPFLRIFGVNGFFVFHSLLLLLILLMGYAYFSLGNPPLLSLAVVTTFCFASAAIVYFLWISPDFFNLFLAFAVLFLCLYKQRWAAADNGERVKPFGHQFLLSDWSDYAAACLAGIAFFSKPPSIVLIGLLAAFAFFKKRFLKTALLVLVFAAVTGAFWGTNYLATGEWNYQGGERKTFYSIENAGREFPLANKGLTFDNTGWPMSSADYSRKHLLPAKISVINFFYYFFGRFTGIIWYFFPAALFLFLFLIQKKSWEQWLILAATAGVILIYVVLMPDNYAGGMLANRYFLHIYPLFFFLPGIKRKGKELVLSWLMAAVFISPILTSPILHSHYPATHAKKLPYKLLPLEMSLVNNLPTSTNPKAFRQEVGIAPDIGWLHFQDDNFHPRNEPEGFWTKGNRPCEMILKTYYPVKELRFNLLNNPRLHNEIKVRVGARTQRISLGKNQRGTLIFPVKRAFKMKMIHLYKIRIKAARGVIPFFEEHDVEERRFLGVFFGVEIVPEK